MVNTLYHITKSENLESIMKEGLIPCKMLLGQAGDVEIGLEKAIYMTHNPQYIYSVDPDLGEIRPENLSVLQIDVSNIDEAELPRDVSYDPPDEITKMCLEYGDITEFDIRWGAVAYYGSIPPERISISNISLKMEQGVGV